jgi:hypothetical protein
MGNGTTMGWSGCPLIAAVEGAPLSGSTIVTSTDAEEPKHRHLPKFPPNQRPPLLESAPLPEGLPGAFPQARAGRVAGFLYLSPDSDPKLNDP